MSLELHIGGLLVRPLILMAAALGLRRVLEHLVHCLLSLGPHVVLVARSHRCAFGRLFGVDGWCSVVRVLLLLVGGRHGYRAKDGHVRDCLTLDLVSGNLNRGGSAVILVDYINAVLHLFIELILRILRLNFSLTLGSLFLWRWLLKVVVLRVVIIAVHLAIVMVLIPIDVVTILAGWFILFGRPESRPRWDLLLLLQQRLLALF